MEPVVVWRRPPKSGPGTPIVVFLHGRGADEHDLIDLADRLPRSFVYAAVRGPVGAPGGGFTWFENRGPARPIAGSLRQSVRDLRVWMDRTSAAAPVHLFGFSAGMMMAAALALDDPARFSSAVLLSGAIAFDAGIATTPGRLAGLRIFYGRGTLDTMIPQDLVRRTTAYLHDRSGATLTVREYPHDHAISNREMADIAAWLSSPPAKV